MSWFTKPPVEAVEIVPRVTPAAQLQVARVRLAAAMRELVAAKNAIAAYRGNHQDLRTAQFDGQTTICLNAMTMHPELSRLERELRAKQERFNTANSEFAAAKKAAGFATYELPV
jgi:hypothetical protein